MSDHKYKINKHHVPPTCKGAFLSILTAHCWQKDISQTVHSMMCSTDAHTVFRPLFLELDFISFYVRMCGPCMGGICIHVCASEHVHTEARGGPWVPWSVIVISSTLICVSHNV